MLRNDKLPWKKAIFIPAHIIAFTHTVVVWYNMVTNDGKEWWVDDD